MYMYSAEREAPKAAPGGEKGAPSKSALVSRYIYIHIYIHTCLCKAPSDRRQRLRLGATRARRASQRW